MTHKIKKGTKVAGEAVFIGSSLAAGTGFIIWVFTLFNIIIPGAAAAFLAGLLVPVINHYLQKLEN